jgi:hypothetical protein
MIKAMQGAVTRFGQSRDGLVDMASLPDGSRKSCECVSNMFDRQLTRHRDER